MTMNKEILQVVEAVSNEKGVNKGIIFEALECALVSATKKRYGADIEVSVSIDRHTGDYNTTRRWQVVAVEELKYPQRQLNPEQAIQRRPGLAPGDWLEEPMESIAFGRIAAQTARQVIVQKVREAERLQVVDAYRSRVGELISGAVKRMEKGSVILDLGSNVEALIPREELIPRESVRTGDRIRAYLRTVRPEVRGPQLLMSRSAPEMLIELFRLEVPEIGEGLIEIMGAARDPGVRAKIAVKAKDTRIDPVGACVGMRGSRVQAVTTELAGERVDIIIWDENPAQFVLNAMSPAEAVSIIIDEDSHSMDVAVPEDQLSLAIGRNGQNVRLASQLTGWSLNVMTVVEAEKKQQVETQDLLNLFMQRLDVDEQVAEILAREGFSSVEEVAYIPFAEMLEIEEFDHALVEELRNRAKNALITEAIVEEERLEEGGPPSPELLAMAGMTEELAHALAALEITTPEELAEQAVDDLMDIEGMDEALAASLIMTARAPWFANEAQG